MRQVVGDVPDQKAAHPRQRRTQRQDQTDQPEDGCRQDDSRQRREYQTRRVPGIQMVDAVGHEVQAVAQRRPRAVMECEAVQQVLGQRPGEQAAGRPQQCGSRGNSCSADRAHEEHDDDGDPDQRDQPPGNMAQPFGERVFENTQGSWPAPSDEIALFDELGVGLLRLHRRDRLVDPAPVLPAERADLRQQRPGEVGAALDRG